MGKTVKEVLVKAGKKGGRKGGGSKKIGRHKVHCARYRAEGRREKNKARKIKKDAKKFWSRLPGAKNK